ncbi:unnamed protein product [Closterium sp. NIES-64]|nr:unnamed protein product [Closterium sp. NIES-64]
MAAPQAAETQAAHGAEDHFGAQPAGSVKRQLLQQQQQHQQSLPIVTPSVPPSHHMPPPPSSLQHRPPMPHHLPPLPVPQWRSGPAGKPMPSSSLWPPHAPAGSFPQPFVSRDYIHSALPLPHSYPPPDWAAGGGNDATERGSGGGGGGGRRFKRRSSRQSGPPVPHPLGLDYGGPAPRGSRMRRPDKQAQAQGQAQARQPRQPRQPGQLRQQQQHKKIWKRRRAPGPGFASAAAAAAAEVNGLAAPLPPLSLPSPGDAEGMLEDGEFRPPRLQELKQRNRVGTRRFFSKFKRRYPPSSQQQQQQQSHQMLSSPNPLFAMPSAPRNTTSFIMQARGGAGPLTPAGAGTSGVGAGASPSPATTPRLLPTPLASSSPAPWGVGLSSSQDGAGEGDIREFRVNPYGSMNGVIRLRTPDGEDDDDGAGVFGGGGGGGGSGGSVGGVGGFFRMGGGAFGGDDSEGSAGTVEKGPSRSTGGSGDSEEQENTSTSESHGGGAADGEGSSGGGGSVGNGAAGSGGRGGGAGEGGEVGEGGGGREAATAGGGAAVGGAGAGAGAGGDGGERRLDLGLQRFQMLYTGDTAGANGMMPHHPVMGMAARGSSGDSFLRARIDEQETQLAQLEEENLTLRERLYVAEQEVKELRRRLGEGSDELVEMGGDNSDDEASCAAAHPAAVACLPDTGLRPQALQPLSVWLLWLLWVPWRLVVVAVSVQETGAAGSRCTLSVHSRGGVLSLSICD